jgi:cytochrome c2
MPESVSQHLRVARRRSRSSAIAAISALIFPGFLVAAASASPVVASFERFYSQAKPGPEQIEGGRLLLTELNCIACHAAPAGWSETLPARPALSLANLSSRLDRSALTAFLRTPHQQAPGSTMPDLVSAEASPDDIARSLGDYLATLGAGAPIAATSTALTGHADAGRDLYQSIGCVACHEPSPGSKNASATSSTSVPINLALSYSAEGLAQFLLDPLASRPDGRMPSSHLTAQEAADVAAFLLAEKPAKSASTSSPGTAATPASIATGRSYFHSLRCVACHDTGEPRPEIAPLKTLAALNSDATSGCLAESGRGVPRYQLSAAQRTSLQQALRELRGAPSASLLTPANLVASTMLRLDCYACHERAGRGGVEKARLTYFRSTDPGAESLGEMGNLPPKLEHTGRKLQQPWLEKLLWGRDGGVRPYLATRMPAFGRASTEKLVQVWPEADRRDPPVAMDTSGLLAHQRSPFGRALMGTSDGGLGCITCHGLKDAKSLGVPVINLTHTVDRLQPAYFKELLSNPQATQPGTMMPPMFMGRPKADQEIEQIWTYLKEIDQQRLPDGLLRVGEFELKPEKEGHALFLRTFLEGAGFQAIAVGFPAQRHAAFDAAEVRWALTWKGRFIDAMTTWEERAMTPAKPLGDDVRTLPGWMPLAQLASSDSAWPQSFGPAAGYTYGGMSLAHDGTPTFRYTVGSLSVADTLTPSTTGPGLHRTLKITGGSGAWWFRGARADAKPQPVAFDSSGAALIEEDLP